jgi:hypothetical protein
MSTLTASVYYCTGDFSKGRRQENKGIQIGQEGTKSCLFANGMIFSVGKSVQKLLKATSEFNCLQKILKIKIRNIPIYNSTKKHGLFGYKSCKICARNIF